jgi:hypothetical protein
LLLPVAMAEYQVVVVVVQADWSKNSVILLHQVEQFPIQ